MAALKKYDSDIPEGHPAQEHRDLQPRDATLRKNGFKIEHRPKDGPAIWSLGGQMFTEEEAYKRCQ